MIKKKRSLASACHVLKRCVVPSEPHKRLFKQSQGSRNAESPATTRAPQLYVKLILYLSVLIDHNKVSIKSPSLQHCPRLSLIS
jgi:hypothetical protein